MIGSKSRSLASAAAVAVMAALMAAPATAQIAGERQHVNPIPYFKDLKPWDPAYKTPRLRDGKPDLQGVWSIASLTTMVRPREFTDLVIPQERIDELTANSYYNKRARDDFKPTDASAGAGDGKGGGDVKGYNNFWIDPGSEYARINGQYRSSWIVDPPNGQVPFTPAGRAVRAKLIADMRGSTNTGPEIRPVGDRCLISFGSQAGPPLTNAMYNNHIQIVQTPDNVVMNVEMNHDARILRVAAKPNPAEVKRWFGDSIAQWEGDVLVVETRNVHPIQERAGAFPLSDKGRVVERFQRVADDQLFYSFTVEDPTYYSQPWKGEIVLRKSKEAIYEYACHEGNYSLPGILRGLNAGTVKAGIDDSE